MSLAGHMRGDWVADVFKTDVVLVSKMIWVRQDKEVLHVAWDYRHVGAACAQVPAVLLVCRNSTDTAYFQRLRPYPRVMLRRGNARFKDYDKTPIGFGVAVFCIAKAPCKCAAPPLYTGLP